MSRSGSRFSRWVGLVGLAASALWRRATRTAPQQTAFMLAGIALPVALLLVVSSVALGLTGGATVASDDVDYWIVPETEASSSLVDVGAPQFGQVHSVADRLNRRSDVAYATPVQVSLLRAESEFVLAVGVIPAEKSFDVAGVSTAGMTKGDPHFAGGGYDGQMTGEAVVSSGAATLLDVGPGDQLNLHARIDSNRSFSVLSVDESGGPEGSFPVVLVHLAELQTLTDTAAGDRADQILVKTSSPGVRPTLEGVYPHSVVLARGGLSPGRVLSSELPLAMAVGALLVTLIVGLLFAATTIGLAVADRAPERAVLAALGVSSRSRAGLVAVETLVVTVFGGALGVGLGVAALPLVDLIGQRFVADVTVTEFHPLFVAYGIAVAAVIGLLVVPYLLYVGRQTVSMEVLFD